MEDFDRAMSPVEGDRFQFRRGEVRIDRVADEQVYFVRWRGRDFIGEPARMSIADWRLAVSMERTREGADPDEGRE